MGKIRCFFDFRLISAVMLSLVLAGCSSMPSWLGGPSKPKVEGERLSVLAHETALTADADASDTKIVIPDATYTLSWEQAGGNSKHLMEHLVLEDEPTLLWKVNIGEGASDENYILAEPIIAEKKVFAIDAEGELSAFDLDTGKEIWNRALLAGNDNETLGGAGLAYADEKVFATTGSGHLYALAAETGDILWQKNLLSPLRSAPTIYEGKLFIVSLDNHITAFDMETGEKAWDYDAVAESTTFLGSPSPAAEGKVVVAAFSSGEIFAFKADNGVPIFSDALIPVRQQSFITGLSAIKGRVVLTDEMMFASSGGDLTAAISVKTGERAWEKDFGSNSQPWIAGDYLFMIANTGEVMAIEQATGKILWLTPLPLWADAEDKEGRIVRYGPVLAGERLLITGSDGSLIGINPVNGDIVSSAKVAEAFSIPPVVADATLVLLDDDGNLRAFR